MLTKNNWFDSNLEERIYNPCLDFEVTIKPYKFKKMNFLEASEFTVNEINSKYKKLYLSFSGGLDSEYVLRIFHKLNVPIIPIIVCCGNEKENEFAYRACDELGIEPIIINVDEEIFFEKFKNEIYIKYNGIGPHSTQAFFAADYAEKNGGYLVTGNHLVGDELEKTSFATINEYDVYIDYSYSNIIHFFTYTMELTNAMFDNVVDNVSWYDYKNKIYGLKYRKKMKAIYTNDLMVKMEQLTMTRECLPKSGICWSKNDIMEKMKCLDL